MQTVSSTTAQSTDTLQHFVQFYDADPAAWARSVGRYVIEGLDAGESVLVIATREHREAISRQLCVLGCSPDATKYFGRLRFCDAEHTLSKFMEAGEPDWDRFQRSVGCEIQRARGSSANGHVRAYGEMVGVLWTARQFAAAIRLEAYWNRVLQGAPLKLFCGYPVNVFSEDFHQSELSDVVSAHTHVLPTGENGDLHDALARALDEVAGVDRMERFIQPEHHPNTEIPVAEAAIWALAKNLPDQARDVIRTARRYYQSEKRFRALIENSSDAIALLDSKAKFTYASASTARVLGFRPHDLVGRNAFELVHSHELDSVQQTIEQAWKRPGDPMQVRARMLSNQGHWRWVEATFTNLLDDPDVGAIVANYRDITQQKEAEERLQKHAEELARYNLELESFAYAATHDLREPLRTVSTFTELLVRRAGSDGENEQYAKFILDSVAHMARMLDDLLALTSVTQGASGYVVMENAVAQAIENLETAIEESGAAITVGPLPCVAGNQSQWVGLMQNLLSNAIKYRSGEPLRIIVTAEPASGGDWLVKVRDNGIGIAPAYHEQIFGLFKRLHQRCVPGTGIGLAICKKIVEGMGGRIWVESEPGKGATFCFTARAANED